MLPDILQDPSSQWPYDTTPLSKWHQPDISGNLFHDTFLRSSVYSFHLAKNRQVAKLIKLCCKIFCMQVLQPAIEQDSTVSPKCKKTITQKDNESCTAQTHLGKRKHPTSTLRGSERRGWGIICELAGDYRSGKNNATVPTHRVSQSANFTIPGKLQP